MDLSIVSTTQAPSRAHDPQQPVATALICPNTLLSAGISSILSGTRFAVLSGVAPSPSQGFSQSGFEPDLYLVYESPAPDRYDATVEMLRARCPSARIVVLADHMEPRAVAHALQAGVSGFCLTAMPREAMLKALELVMLGEVFVPVGLVFAMLGGDVRDPQSKPGIPVALVPANDFAAVATSNKLSGREAQILHCLTQGASNKLIARELGLAEATVKVHIKSILRKVKAANRTQAALWASEHMNLA
jgi:two-component system nitrate/nitrite response regulator NarL